MSVKWESSVSVKKTTKAKLRFLNLGLGLKYGDIVDIAVAEYFAKNKQKVQDLVQRMISETVEKSSTGTVKPTPPKVSPSTPVMAKPNGKRRGRPPKAQQPPKPDNYYEPVDQDSVDDFISSYKL